MPGPRIDLNLYYVFDAVMRHLNAARAASELEVTPSAVSHALARLRKLIGDELFTSTPAGLVPTLRADRLAPVIADILSRSGQALSQDFDAGRSTRIFHVAASDYFTTILLPDVMRRLNADAPGVSLRLFPAQRVDLATMLDNGTLDLALGWFDLLPEKIARAELLREKEAVIVRSDHPLLSRTLTIDGLSAYRQVMVELTSYEGELPRGFLADRGIHRRVLIDWLLIEGMGGAPYPADRVGVTVPHYAAVAPIVERTDLLGKLPSRLAARAVKEYGVTILQIPDISVPIQTQIIFAERSAHDEGIAWIVKLIRNVAGTL